MPKNILQIAIEDHRAARLTKAEQGYLASLAADPDNAEALHWLGVLRYQAGQIKEAVGLLERAVARTPHDPAYQHNLGQAYQSAGQKDAAIKAFSKAATLDPQSGEALISLGLACLNRGLAADASAAVAALRRAQATGIESADMHHRLGVAFLSARRFPEAVASLTTALLKKSNDHVIHYHLALAHRGTGEPKETRKYLAKALELEAGYGPAWCALGMLDAEAGNFAAAAGLFRRAIAANRDDLQAYRGLARVLKAVGKNLEADASLKQVQRVISTEPADASAASQSPDVQSDVAKLEQVLTPSKAQAQIHFGMAVVMNVFPPAKLPGPAITGLFDRYAPNFESHLRKLEYRAPEAIADALADVWNGKPLDVLDLGCGTGLCGPLIRHMAAFLAGVDLSRGMIEKAEERHAYDRLEEGDIVENLRLRPRAYDLLVSADVLIYLGDLSPTFEAAASALRAGGLFCFSVEAGVGDRYILQMRSHRYAHSKPYLQRLASIFGFAEVKFLEVELRKESAQPVMGFLVVLRLIE